MSVLVEFAMFPTDKGESVSSFVARIINFIDKSGIPYNLTPMGTIFETESIEEAMKILGKAYKLLEPDCNRVYCVVKFDIRMGKSNRLEGKVRSVEEKVKREIRKLT